MGWRDLFRRRPSFPDVPPASDPPPAGDSAEDWRPGDLAECLNDAGWFLGGIVPSEGPECGEVRLVVDVQQHYCPIDRGAVQFLYFDRFGTKRGYVARFFRKITPRADAAERGEHASLDDLLRAPATEPA